MSIMECLTLEGERRQHSRIIMQRPCKVFDPHGRRYLAATTRDVSAGGALIDLPRLTNLKPGDRVHVGIALKRREQFLRADEMLEAVITRATATVDDHTLLGVCFAHAQEHPAIALHSDEPLRIAA